MPRASKRAKLLEFLLQDTLEVVSLSNGMNEIDQALWDGLERYELVNSFRCSVPKLIVPKSEEWYSQILPMYDDSRFKMYVRVSRRDFARILSFIEDNEAFSIARKRQMPVAKQLAITLYRFGINGTGASVGNIAATFGVGDGGTVLKITERVIKVLVDNSYKWITWPVENERKEMSAKYVDGFPNCVGFIDGSHIDLEERPRDDHEAYFDRKQNYSIQLQAICDWDKRIRHVQELRYKPESTQVLLRKGMASRR